jgi:MFS family permease
MADSLTHDSASSQLETERSNEANRCAQSTSRPVYEASDGEKVALAAYEGHDADIPSNEGYILDERAELKRVRSIATQRNQANKSDEDRGFATGDIEKGPGESSVDEDVSNTVWWDRVDDPENPMNFQSWRKTSTMVLVSGICFVTPLASSMFAPGVPQLMEEFNSTNAELASFVVSIYILGYAVGPLFLAPLSEIYGRLPIYHVCNVFFIVFTVACALATNLNMLIGFRFMEGVFGSAPLTNGKNGRSSCLVLGLANKRILGGGTIADIFVQERRGLAIAMFSMGPVLGPVGECANEPNPFLLLTFSVGPVAGGYLAEAKGWRWVFWVLAMVSGVFAISSFIFMRETYAVIILQRKARRLQKETGNLALRSKLDVGLSPKDFFIRSIIRPAKMLIFSPVVLMTSIYVGIAYGYLYLLFTTFALVFEGTYGFSSGSVGLTFLGLGVGSLIGLAFFAIASDRMLKSRAAAADAHAATTGVQAGGMKPEYRLPPLISGAILIPIGLLLYGWTAHFHVHYIVPIMSTALIGMGNLITMMCISTYLIDSFTLYAASAMAANTIIRSIMGAVLPLAGQSMYKTLGLGWGNSLLAFIGIGMIPVPFVLLKWGEKLRKRFEIKNL